MIRYNWKMTAVAVAVVGVVFSWQVASAATNHKLSVNSFQPNACTAILAKLDLTTVRASLEHFDQRVGSKFGGADERRHGDFESVPSYRALA